MNNHKDSRTLQTPHTKPKQSSRIAATHYDTLQHTVTHCNTPQHTATHCNTLQHTATHCNTLYTPSPNKVADIAVSVPGNRCITATH